ncbi:MAG TPA: hypothetical protein VIL85_23355 [Thermomicrobiales bacterium]|jgi:membrane protein implicated in regulation of membrane protease activity
MQQKLRNAPGWVKYVLNAFIEGTLGNIGHGIFLAIVAAFIGLIVLLIRSAPWALLGIGFFAAVSLIALMLYIVRRLDSDLTQRDTRLAEIEADRTHAVNTVKLDDHLFQLLSALVAASSDERDTTFKQIVVNLLQDITEVVEGVSRGALLKREDDYLIPWVPYEMPESRINGIRFYVGNDHSRYKERGVAGIAYETQLLQTVHISQEGNIWNGDHPAYTPPIDASRRPPYLSFVAIPLIGQLEEGQNAEPVGVLCLDSPTLTAFDAPETPQTLLVLGDRLLIAIVIHETLRQLGS